MAGSLVSELRDELSRRRRPRQPEHVEACGDDHIQLSRTAVDDRQTVVGHRAPAEPFLFHRLAKRLLKITGRPVFQELQPLRADVLPKSPINAAIGYVQNHWEALIRYASSGYLAIDNNVAEQHMKTIATGRKNWLFTGSEEGGKTMAILFSVVSSCQRHGHDPFAYLRDVLGRLPALPKERLQELLPGRWSPLKAADTTAATAGSNGAGPVD